MFGENPNYAPAKEKPGQNGPDCPAKIEVNIINQPKQFTRGQYGGRFIPPVENE
jgi:hypothetical protein